MLTRVEVRYPTDVLIRYMEQPPRRGAPVRGPGGAWLFVSKVRSDEAGGYTVDCIPVGTFVREAGRLSQANRRRVEHVRRRVEEARRLLPVSSLNGE